MQVIKSSREQRYIRYIIKIPLGCHDLVMVESAVADARECAAVLGWGGGRLGGVG